MLISNCFKDFFAFKKGTCNNVTSTSGLYIDNIAGINMLSVTSNGNSTFENPNELLEEKTNLALEIVASDLGASLNSLGYIIQPNKQFETAFCIKEPNVVISNIAANGIRLMQRKSISSLLAIQIPFVRVYTASQGDVKLSIKTEGIEVHTQTISTIGGELIAFSIPYHLQKYNGSLDLLISGTASVYDTNIHCGTTECCLCCCNAAGAIEKGYEVQALENGSVSNEYSSYGIMLEYAIFCDISSFLCKYKEVIKMPLYSKVAQLILQELAFPNLLSAQNGISEEIGKIASYWESQYISSIKNAIAVLAKQKSNNDKCFLCTNYQRIKLYSLK